MSLLDLILDFVGLKKYPENPRIEREHFAIGVNAHIPSIEDLPRIRAAGFDTVLIDLSSDYPPSVFDELFPAAQAAGLRVFLTDIQGWDPATVFLRWGHSLNYVSPANEPDQKKFWPGSIPEYVDRVRRVAEARRVFAPAFSLVVPCASGLSKHKDTRKGTKELIQGIAKISLASQDFIGHHIYAKTPDSVIRELNRWIRRYRKIGWKNRIWVSETGWETPPASQGDQAIYTVNTLAQLSRHPAVYGAAIYCWRDDLGARPPEQYGIYGKAAARKLKEVISPA